VSADTATLWLKHKRELSLLKLVRHFQALAARWMQAIFQSELELYHFLQRACATAERLAAKASRKRRTTAQILQDDLRQPSNPSRLPQRSMLSFMPMPQRRAPATASAEGRLIKGGPPGRGGAA